MPDFFFFFFPCFIFSRPRARLATNTLNIEKQHTGTHRPRVVQTDPLFSWVKLWYLFVSLLPQGSSERVLPWQVTVDQLIGA